MNPNTKRFVLSFMIAIMIVLIALSLIQAGSGSAQTGTSSMDTPTSPAMGPKFEGGPNYSPTSTLVPGCLPYSVSQSCHPEMTGVPNMSAAYPEPVLGTQYPDISAYPMPPSVNNPATTESHSIAREALLRVQSWFASVFAAAR